MMIARWENRENQEDNEKLREKVSHSFSEEKDDDYWILNRWWLLSQEVAELIKNFHNNLLKNYIVRLRQMSNFFGQENKEVVVWLLIYWLCESCEHTVWIILQFAKWFSFSFDKTYILHEWWDSVRKNSAITKQTVLWK